MKTLIRRLKNIIRWLPILWNDADFDYEFLLDILEFKLKNMQGFFKNEALVSDGDDISVQICKVIFALQRYRNYDRIEERRQQDFEFVFNTLKDKLQEWWD